MSGNPFTDTTNTVYATKVPPSYTLHTFYGDRLDTFKGKNIYIGEKYLRPRCRIPF